IAATDSIGGTASQAYTVVVIPSQFAYDPTTKTLIITNDSTYPNFQFTQVTTANATGTSTVYTFTLSDNAKLPSSVSQAFPDTALSTAADVPAVVVNGVGGTAILTASDTYKDASGATQETPERVSLGSKTDKGVGVFSKFVGNNSSNA